MHTFTQYTCRFLLCKYKGDERYNVVNKHIIAKKKPQRKQT